ncbi:hormogonium polysaccharide biosynthesis protein HpsA [Anabaena sp. CCY 9910]|uniref:hormogonium polysaccharide biosynthesis protein HpsA n=1 Tax=Anabaena sp. CCY 9910 TaxID=3103870 RepID=UPI0039E1BC99
MTIKRQLVKTIKKTAKLLKKNPLSTFKRQINKLLRTFFVNRKRRGAVNAGFVLPTVAMVALVVVLLTTAILFRSFERAKNASNVRVNEVVLNAATPALDRARAKMDALFEDPTLPRGTPSDNSLYEALKRTRYTLGDETRLKLGFDIDNSSSISQPTSSTALENDETLKTAWKYGVDTDNNGLKDTITLYGIFFRSPSRDSTSGLFSRERNPLEARTPPMDNSTTNQACTGATGFANLVGNSSWYRLNSGNLGKSFFVYVVNVPITDIGSLSTSEYETYKGNKGVVALELQQDRNRVPLPNNAVWFENDLEVVVGSTNLRLNGRVHTNGNLLVAETDGGDITFRQVSSKTSCFYNQENGQIIVGGNVKNGSFSQASSANIAVDLYRGFNNGISTANISDSNKSTNAAKTTGNIEFNDAAFNERISVMKTSAIALCSTCNSATTTSALKTAVAGSTYPEEVRNNVEGKVQTSDDLETAKTTLYNEIEIYLRNRTRRVPFAEVPSSTGLVTATDGYPTSINIGDTTIGDTLAPPATWREPINSSNQLTGATSISITTNQLPATNPNVQRKEGIQTELGDRVFVGNNLPAKWVQNNKYVGAETNQLIFSSGATPQAWTRNGTETQTQRWRNTQIQALADLGIADRDGFWEENASKTPVNDLDSVGGVRIVTGAGLYVDGTGTLNTGTDATTGPYYPRDTNSFLSTPTAGPGVTLGTNDVLVWPDTMPMSRPGETRKGDLLMRATAVYHYKVSNTGSNDTNREPIACVSSYYDPSDEVANKNKTGLTVPPVPPATTPTTVNLPWNSATGGKSNNGIVYSYPSGGRGTFFNTHKARLERQANLKFPNGRWANKPLRDAIIKMKGSGTSLPSTVPTSGLQLSDYSAIDTALCAISILTDEAAFVATPTDLPKHGAISESAFLDAREVKQLSTSSLPTRYELDLEQRQPLEIRVTDIDLSTTNSIGITNTAITTNEFLLPYSGIIYATRDDGLRDQSVSFTEGNVSEESNSKLLSPTDFRLDPTRRPNGIRLINGGTLARTTTNVYNAKEKGLILATNLPAYIKGDFNLHRTSTTTGIEEFTQTEPTTGTYNSDNFYNRSTRNESFACRKDRPGCTLPSGDTTGDFWRSATIIADSMTLLSSNFVDGVRRLGDYDLNNNNGIVVEDGLTPTSSSATLATLDSRRLNRLKNGFWENGYVTSAYWTDSSTPRTGAISSYLVNGVTPIQRRVANHPLYVMEICRKLPVSECTPDDWVVGFDRNGDGDLNDTALFDVNRDGVVNSSDIERNVKAYQLGQAIIASYGSNIASTDNILQNSELSWTANFPSTSFPTSVNNRNIRRRLGAGDTGNDLLALEGSIDQDRRFPRRVAFARNNSNNLVQPTTGIYQPLGVGCPLDTTGTAYTNNGCTGTSIGLRDSNIRSLWFRTTNSTTNPGDIAQAVYASDKPLFYYPPIDGTDADSDPDLDGQPLLVPVLQVHDARKNPPNLRTDATAVASGDDFRGNWLQEASSDTTTFNATFVIGNSPSRTEELSAGLQNFVRFLENWGSATAKISGSFIQLNRSSFSTAPIAPIFTNRQSNTVLGGSTALAASSTYNLSLFDYALDTYPTGNSNGLLPFYDPPTRTWGFDVALLSEQPDLFAQRFTAPPLGRPNEFFREIGRDDPWVKILLCAGEPGTGTTYTSAVPSQYRPSDCQAIPND